MIRREIIGNKIIKSIINQGNQGQDVGKYQPPKILRGNK